MHNIIGISGKFGSGKSHIGQIISEATGIPIVKLDERLTRAMLKPVLKQIAQSKIRGKLCLQHNHLLTNFGNMVMPTRFDRWLLRRVCDQEIRKIIRSTQRSGTPIILDFFCLPTSKYAPKFRMNILVTSDPDARTEKVTTRNGFTPTQVANLDAIAASIVGYDDFPFDFTLTNDYASTPTGVDEIIRLLPRPHQVHPTQSPPHPGSPDC